MDVGICPGNYYDYESDEVAIQCEAEIAESLEAYYFKDEAFPANARSLYFDSISAPKGVVPSETVKWSRISEGALVYCEKYTFYEGNQYSCQIQQGALGDGYFVNTLRILSCYPSYIRRLLVSDKYANQGLYTLKFQKAGRWRYVHIDDRIPCRQSGRANFCRNRNPNETFAMLLEKGYAKLHGCYEAINNGTVEKLLSELTPGGVQALRLDALDAVTVCDNVYDMLDSALRGGKVIGCGRFVPSAHKENPTKRQGISLGT
jgi:hypothetical protein